MSGCLLTPHGWCKQVRSWKIRYLQSCRRVNHSNYNITPFPLKALEKKRTEVRNIGGNMFILPYCLPLCSMYTPKAYVPTCHG